MSVRKASGAEDEVSATLKLSGEDDCGDMKPAAAPTSLSSMSGCMRVPVPTVPSLPGAALAPTPKPERARPVAARVKKNAHANAGRKYFRSLITLGSPQERWLSETLPRVTSTGTIPATLQQEGGPTMKKENPEEPPALKNCRFFLFSAKLKGERHFCLLSLP